MIKIPVKHFVSITNDVLNITAKDLKALTDSAEAFRKTNNFKVYENDTVETLQERFELKLPLEITSTIAKNSSVPYTNFLIIFIIKRILTTNRPPIKLKSLSLEEYNSLKLFLQTIHA